MIDMFMPGMDGLATIRELIKIDSAVPFIAISGHAFGDRRQGAPDFLGMAIKLGATAALQKRFDILDLLEAVDRALDVRQRLMAGAPQRAAKLHPSGRHHDKNTGG